MARSFSASVLISAMLFWKTKHMFFTKKEKMVDTLVYKKKLKSFTNAAKVNERGNAQANIMINPNCNANSRNSANKDLTYKDFHIHMYLGFSRLMKSRFMLPSKSPSSSSSPMLAEKAGLR